jgi:putative membrane protein
MLIAILISIFLGIFSGVITGITPGLHINLVNVGVLAIVPFLPSSTPVLALCIFILAMSVTHTFVDALPSIYLGAPDPDHALSVLPGHRLLIAGKGHSAILYTIIGSLGALIISLACLPLFVFLIRLVSDTVKTYIGYILIVVMIYMIAKEATWEKRLSATALFLLAGSLGTIVFILPSMKQPLFPLLSGLFGISILLPSLFSSSSFPKQLKENEIDLPLSQQSKSVVTSTYMGLIAAFLPGFGSSQAAIIASQLVGKIREEGFLVLTGGINTANMVISLATAYAVQKARNGSIVSILSLIPEINQKILILFALVACIAGGAATIITMKLSKIALKLMAKAPYKTIMLTIISAIIIVTFLFDGFVGLIVLTTAIGIGLTATNFNVGKNYLMGCLLVPVIIYFL